MITHYESLHRPTASRNLLAALESAKQKIAQNPAAGLPAPRPYPTLKKPNRLWLKSGRYWLAYRPTNHPSSSPSSSKPPTSPPTSKSITSHRHIKT